MRKGLSCQEAGSLGWKASKKRRDKQEEDRILKYLQNSKKCKFCSKDIPYEKRECLFCNSSCSASFNNHLFPKRHKIVKEKVIKIKVIKEKSNKIRQKKTSEILCLFCGKKINYNAEKYCSGICQTNDRWRNRKKNIELSGSEKSSRIAKRYLKELRGHRCEICSCTEWMGQPIPLVLDHIDGHSENNKIDNLRLVCGNCDMQLGTYKSKNKGNGRAYRRQRYAEGKSY